MSVLFSKVALLADDCESTVGFLVCGIPQDEDDLKGYAAYDDFVEEHSESECFDVEVESYIYGIERWKKKIITTHIHIWIHHGISLKICRYESRCNHSIGSFQVYTALSVNAFKPSKQHFNKDLLRIGQQQCANQYYARR